MRQAEMATLRFGKGSWQLIGIEKERFGRPADLPEERLMARRRRWELAIVLVLTVVPSVRAAEDLTPAQRGERALLGRSFLHGTIPISAYENVWRVWSN